jgi:hypothetical protein
MATGTEASTETEEIYEQLEQTHPAFYARVSNASTHFPISPVAADQINQISKILVSNAEAISDELVEAMIEGNGYQDIGSMTNSFGLLAKVRLIANNSGEKQYYGGPEMFDPEGMAGSSLPVGEDPPFEPDPPKVTQVTAVARTTRKSKAKTATPIVNTDELLKQFIDSHNKLEKENKTLVDRNTQLESQVAHLEERIKVLQEQSSSAPSSIIMSQIEAILGKASSG